MIRIKPIDPAGPAIQLDLTDFETVEGGLGGWETLARPRTSAAAGWVGLPEKTLTLPVILDGVEADGPGLDRSIERDLRRVLALGRPVKKKTKSTKQQEVDQGTDRRFPAGGGTAGLPDGVNLPGQNNNGGGKKEPDDVEPPVLEVHLLPSVGKHEQWVVQSIEQGQYMRAADGAGDRVQQYLTINLLRYRPAELVAGPAKKSKNRHQAVSAGSSSAQLPGNVNLPGGG